MITRALIFFCVLILAGCGPNADLNQRMLNTLSVGTSRDELIRTMGMPQKREVYGNTEFLMYATRQQLGAVTQEELTPIAIVDGKVVGFGPAYYQQVIRADVTVRHR